MVSSIKYKHYNLVSKCKKNRKNLMKSPQIWKIFQIRFQFYKLFVIKKEKKIYQSKIKTSKTFKNKTHFQKTTL